MKRVALLFTAALMVFSFGLANAQDAVTFDAAGLWDDGGTATVNPGNTVTFTMGFVVATSAVNGGSNGFEIYIADNDGDLEAAAGGVFTTPVGAALEDMSAYWNGGFFINDFSLDGAGADTLGFGGFAISSPGVPVGPELPLYTIETAVDVSMEGKFLCIDSAFYPPGGQWLWSTSVGDVFAYWGGPYCFPILTQPNIPAEFVGFPTVAFVADHCATFSYQFDGVDPDPEQCAPYLGDVTYSLVDDGGLAGATMSAAGMFSYAPTLADVGGSYTVTVGIEDACGDGEALTFDISFTNVAPTVACDVQKPIGKGQTIEIQIVGTDVDCDNGTYTIGSVTPAPVGAVSIDPNTGLLSFATADPEDGGITFDIAVVYSDGDLADTCHQFVEVLVTEPFQITLEKTHDTYQGGHEYVDVAVDLGSEQMWGFDMLIAYDASALSFQTALPGTIYDVCGWEYFTYRYGADGNCSGGCPSGLLRVVGIAETNNGANHPSCFDTKGETLFTLDFLVSDDRTLECMYVPIRFFWMDCGDNSVSFHESQDVANPYSQRLAISRSVYDFEGSADMAADAVFPTYLGAPNVCLETSEVDKDVPVRFIDFYNGGIDIVCADSIDARGDINLNGLAYEISDAVLYSNYFVYGIGVFTNYQGQVAASDVNADGIPLSVGDLVYLIRVVVGDALAYPKVAPVTASVTYDGSEISVNDKMGAAYVVIDGQATPTLLVDNMEMKYAFDANENVTRVLVYSTVANQTFQGAFLDADGSVNYVEMATQLLVEPELPEAVQPVHDDRIRPADRRRLHPDRLQRNWSAGYVHQRPR